MSGSYTTAVTRVCGEWLGKGTDKPLLISPIKSEGSRLSLAQKEYGTVGPRLDVRVRRSLSLPRRHSAADLAPMRHSLGPESSLRGP